MKAVRILRAAGALFGSRAHGDAGPGSDTDVAAYFGACGVVASDLPLPADVGLLVLDTAPLELAVRVAVSGALLFEVDAAARVRWEATTRKIWFDERPRFERAHREFLASVRDG